jgi:hypothetical protein
MRKREKKGTKESLKKERIRYEIIRNGIEM